MASLPAIRSRVGRSELRHFGLISGCIFAGFLGLALPLLRHHSLAVWPWVVGAMLVAGALIYPPALRPVYVVWTRLGQFLGWVNLHIVLAVVFYLLVTPAAVLLRLFGRDPMARSFEPKLESYRVTSRHSPIRNIERPY